VPGVLSMQDNAFGHLLAGLAGEPVEMVPPGGKWLNAGCVFGPRRTVAWRILDAKHFGLAQRRKRVFVVACPPDRADPLEILFETAPVRRDTQPSLPKGKHLACTPEGLAGTVCRKWATGSGGPSGNEYHNLVIDRHASHWNGDVHPTLNTQVTGGTYQELFAQGGAGLVPALLRMREGKPGGGKGPLVSEGISQALTCSNDQTLFVYPVDLRMLLRDIEKKDEMPVGAEGTPAYTLTRAHTHGVAICGEDEYVEAAVRKLTPLECERLQGFPDNYTDFPYRVKEHAPDTHRYAALGNSMAVNCMRWIGERIKAQLESRV
ncbi:MAG: DNA cytosine methyltransferase, partial [Mailhella sp.]|nr:DNA cytosine methyltransferase [Mailhella sp.]